MIRYSLNRQNFKKFENLNIYKIEDLSSLENSIGHISKLIELFNKEYTWDKMFDIEDVYERIKNQNKLFLLFYGDTSVGYVFFKPIDVKICFGYNLYVSKTIKRPSWSAKWFYNKVSGIMLETYENIEVEIDDWNDVVLNMVEDLGYKIM